MRNFPALLMILGGVLLTLSGVDCKQWKVPEILPGPAKAGDVVVIIYESNPSDAEYSADIAGILAMDQYWSGLAKRGLRWTKYDKEMVVGEKLKAAIAPFKVPILAILTAEGDPVYVGACPRPLEKLDEKIKEVTGK